MHVFGHTEKKRKRKANAKTNSDSSAKLKKIVLVMLFKFITNMQSTLCLTFSVHVRTIQCLNYSGQDSKTKFTGYDSNTPVTLKQSQGHQTWYDLADPKQGYNNLKFEKPRLNNVCEKANNKRFCHIRKKKSLSSLNNAEVKKVVYS